METFAAPLDTTPDPAIVQPPGASPSVPPREQQQEQLRIGESGQFGEGLEDRGLLESSTRLKPHEAQSYRKKALWVSWVSIIVTLALAVAAFTVSVMRYSASSFGFAFDATLDVLSSAIVLWRYSNAAAVHSAHREYIACVILGVIFLLSSICIVIKAIHDLAKRVLPEVLLPPIPEPCTNSRNETGDGGRAGKKENQNGISTCYPLLAVQMMTYWVLCSHGSFQEGGQLQKLVSGQ